MSFIADEDVFAPVLEALKSLRFDIIPAPARPDRNLLAKTLEMGKVLITRDTGIPSQAYAFQYAQNGLTVVLLRWKGSNPKAWQEIVVSILRHSEEWEEIAKKEPSVISVSRTGYRARAWSSLPEAVGKSAQVLIEQKG